MFESLKHWLESIGEESRLFEHAEDETLHSALASLLYHFIAADERHGGKEKHEFDRIMKQDLDLSQAQIDHLYEAARSATGELRDDPLTIHWHLKDNPAVRMRFMQLLLQLISMHGVHSPELALLYEALHEVFPALRDVGRTQNL